jgi:hypothetical protein
MKRRDLGAGRTFDLMASARRTEARQTRRHVAPIVLGAAAVGVGIAVGGRLGSGIAVCGLLLTARALRPLSKRWLVERRRGDRDTALDRAVEATFPASDPVAF